LQQVYSVYVN